MTLQRKLRETWRAARWGAALATLLGVVLLLLGGLERSTLLLRWSYDLPFLVRPQAAITNVVIVYMDDLSHDELGQPRDRAWDRTVHAQLLERLTGFGARAVAFDVIFAGATTREADDALKKAIRAHGQVVLAADLGSSDYYGIASDIVPIRPTNFLAATPHWGFNQLGLAQGDDTQRKHFHGWEDVPSLSWKLASVLGAKTTTEPNGQRMERWLNYYGPHGTIPSLSFYRALKSSDPALREFFRDKIVFIGSATQAGYSGKRRDQFRTPYSRLGEPVRPGVDFHATQFLNLMRGDWLRTPPPWAELGLIAFFGLVAGAVYALLRPWTAVFVAIGVAIAVTVAACVLVWQTNVWFAWLIIVAVQIPAALACSVVHVAQKRSIASDADVTAEFPRAPAVSAAAVPDYEMLRQIGSGSYGQVWLARSVTGVFRAVKIVDWKSPNDSRFEREFTGLKKFEPISRAHDGLVDILHVGRNDAARHLYYVMELADSCGSDPESDADGYVPATLKTRLQADGAVSARDCIAISLTLTSALAFLHEQGLIHRDIKPSNIIFVSGHPRLADIGLVAAADETLSFVGTEGYIPPEGPGAPAADVFSLGKVLSELIGRTKDDNSSSTELRDLRQVIEKACARELADRYKTGAEMLDGLRLACGTNEERGVVRS